MRGGARIGIFGVVMLVLLRMATGYHFYSEGTEKLSPDFSSRGFLESAKGPLGPWYRSWIPSEHRWKDLLASPRRSPTSTDARGEAAPAPSHEQVPAPRRELEEAPFLGDEDQTYPYSAWGQQIIYDWEQTLDAYLAMPELSEQQREQAEEVFRERVRQLAGYLDEYSQDISDYRHDLWRLAQLEQQQEKGSLPYLDAQIALKTGETIARPRPWLQGVERIEISYLQDLDDVLTPEQQEDASLLERVEQTLHPPEWLPTIDRAVTVLTIGVGVCLLFGIGTRIASLGGAAFLLSVMATQPPWVADANTTYFGYQLVELAVLLTLCAVGAGRWAGWDGVIARLFAYRRAQPTPADAS